MSTVGQNSRRSQRAVQKHAESLGAVDQHLEAKEYHHALEVLRRISFDTTLPAEARVRTKAREVEALIGLAREVEAFRAAVDLERMIERYRLDDRLAEEMALVIEKAEELRGA